MASSCTLHGIVGIQKATAYCLEPKKRFWKMEGFVPLSADADNEIGDLPVSVFTFGGKNMPPEDGIYFINARVITATTDDETTLELYCVDVCLRYSIIMCFLQRFHRRCSALTVAGHYLLSSLLAKLPRALLNSLMTVVSTSTSCSMGLCLNNLPEFAVSTQ
jgi:hypothetical protein